MQVRFSAAEYFKNSEGDVPSRLAKLTGPGFHFSEEDGVVVLTGEDTVEMVRKYLPHAEIAKQESLTPQQVVHWVRSIKDQMLNSEIAAAAYNYVRSAKAQPAVKTSKLFGDKFSWVFRPSRA